LHLKILYDNEDREGFRSGWGFSYLIGGLLFDTGADVDTLLFNVHKLNVDLNKIRIVVFSHEHMDHIRGFRILGMLKKARVSFQNRSSEASSEGLPPF